jgi:peptidyl-prolyl cis-trans isomerase A (cyclophilin A)
MFALVLALALQTPAVPAAPTGPVVALETSMGTIKIELEATKSPISTKNFLDYVKSGHYDGTIFHRVIPGFMIQGGGMTVGMTEKEGKPPIRNEARNGLRNSRGTVAMARTNDPDSATAQFFINLKDNAMLDFGMAGAGYAVFGKVIDGMKVVDDIAMVPTGNRLPHQNVPRTPILIKKATVVSGSPAKVAPAPAKP